MRLGFLFLLIPCLSFGQGYTLRDAAFVGAAGFSVASGGGGGAPTWGGEITAARMSETASSSTTATAVNRTCTVGEHIIVFVYCLHATQTASVTDAAGNTYTQRATYLSPANDYMTIFSAPVTSQLASGQNITITWASPAYSYRGACFGYASNIGATPVDVAASGRMTFGTSAAQATVTTTAANTLCVAWLLSDSSSITYGSGSFTGIGAASIFGDPGNHYFLQSAFTSTGAKAPGGTWSSATTGEWIMVAFK